MYKARGRIGGRDGRGRKGEREWFFRLLVVEREGEREKVRLG